MFYWFTLDWWKYLLEPISRYQRGYASNYKWLNKLKIMICRARGHPYGVHWFSSGDEPDMHCKNCGEDLG